MRENLTCFVSCLQGANTFNFFVLSSALIILSMILVRKLEGFESKLRLFVFANISALFNIPLVFYSMNYTMKCDSSLLNIYGIYLLLIPAVFLLSMTLYGRLLVRKYGIIGSEKILPWIGEFVGDLVDAEVYILNTAIPKAFAMGRKIFVSGGLLEILSREELKAVLAHEAYHVKNRKASLLKGISMMTFLPYVIGKDMELAADEFASAVVGREHLESARKKLREF